MWQISVLISLWCVYSVDSCFFSGSTPLSTNCQCGTSGLSPNTTPSLDNFIDDEKIIGGELTEIIYQPWMVKVRNTFFGFCGGSIISQDSILTAAHCVYSYRSLPFFVSVYVGSTESFSGTKYKASKIFIHEQYYESVQSRNDYLGDIAVIKLSKPLEITGVSKPICLLQESSDLYNDNEAFIAGWGKESSTGEVAPILKNGTITLKTAAACSSINEYSFDTVRGHLCGVTVPSEDSICQGDSGGPVWIVKDNRAYQIGVNSLVEEDCRIMSVAPNIYSDVTEYYSWIKEVTDETGYCHL